MGLLTMIVSLEAIFLSTFVDDRRNRADSRRSVVADLPWQTVREATQHRELLETFQPDPGLTKAIHSRRSSRPSGHGSGNH